jgi:hypothetical protein
VSGGGPRLDRDVTLTPVLADGAAVKLIGLGGVGGIIARYLVVFLRSLDRDVRLVLIDGDVFASANAARMVFGRNGRKVDVVRDELLPLVEESRVTLGAVSEYLGEENISRLIGEGDLLLLAVDNHATRKLVSDYCESALTDCCLISGGNDGIEDLPDGRSSRGTYGNCQIYVKEGGVGRTAPLTHLHPEIAEPADEVPGGPDCTELVHSVPQILFANLMVASAILNALFLHLCGALHYEEVCFDIADALMRPMPGGPDPSEPKSASPGPSE